MTAREVSEVSKKDMFLHEPEAPWLHLGEEGGQCERKHPRGHHQGCCDITGSGMELKAPRGQNICLLTLICGWVTVAICFFSCHTPPNPPALVYCTVRSHGFVAINR